MVHCAASNAGDDESELGELRPNHRTSYLGQSPTASSQDDSDDGLQRLGSNVRALIDILGTACASLHPSPLSACLQCKAIATVQGLPLVKSCLLLDAHGEAAGWVLN